MAIALRRQWRGDSIEAALAGVATIGLVKLAAALHFEQRPFVSEHVHALVTHAADNSFPSDHLAAAGLAFAFLWPRSKPMALAALVTAIVLGAARVALFLHWPVDVIAGFALGALAVILVRAVVGQSKTVS